MESPGYAAIGGPAELDDEQVWAFLHALRMHGGRILVTPRTVVVPQPAAGAEWTAAVPGGTTWIPLCFVATFTTDGTVTNRTPNLAISDGNVNVYVSRELRSVAASHTIAFNGARGIGAGNLGLGGADDEIAIPILPLVGGMTIGSSTTTLQAGDQWSAVRLYVLELRERTAAELVAFAERLLTGSHAEPFPGLDLYLTT